MDGNPTGYWRFGESSGTNAADETGNNDGTYQNGVTLGVSGENADVSDTAADFDGSNDRVVIAHDTAYETNAGSIQVSFNADNVSGNNYILHKNGGGGELRLYVDDGVLKAKLAGDQVEIGGIGANE